MVVVVLPLSPKNQSTAGRRNVLARNVALVRAVEVSKLFLNLIFTLVTKLLKAGFAHRSTLVKLNYSYIVSLL